MKTNTHSVPSLALAILTALLASQSPGQQPGSVPFEKAVRIDVIPSKPAAVKGGDWDDKMQKIVLRLKFTNSDTRQSFEGYSATVSALCQSVLDRQARKVLMQDQVALSLPPRQMLEHECPEVVTRFDKTGLKFGYYYDGWIVVVKDASGKVVHVKSTSPAYEKLPEKAAKVAKNLCYNGKLDPVGDPGNRSFSSQ